MEAIPIPQSDNGKSGTDESSFLQLQRMRRREETDVDSASSSSSSSLPSSSDEIDLKFTVAADALFFAGSAIQFSLAVWDVVYERSGGDDDDGDDDDDSSGENDDDDDAVKWRVYSALASTATFLFIFNAILDFAWSRVGSGRYGGKPCNEAAAAVAFGIAATLECVTTFVDDDSNPWSYITNMVSCHIYLLSGIIYIWDEGLPLRCHSCSKMLMSVGIVLYIAGSCIDVVMSYLYDPELSNVSALTLARCNVASSLLWVLDAVLYAVANFMTYSIPARIVQRCPSRKWCEKKAFKPPGEVEISIGSDDNRRFTQPMLSENWSSAALMRRPCPRKDRNRYESAIGDAYFS